MHAYNMSEQYGGVCQSNAKAMAGGGAVYYYKT